MPCYDWSGRSVYPPLEGLPASGGNVAPDILLPSLTHDNDLNIWSNLPSAEVLVVIAAPNLCSSKLCRGGT